MIHEIAIDRDANTINLALLHDEFSDGVAGVVGVSTGDYGVRVHFDHKPSDKEGDIAREIVKRHDPKKLTNEQEAFERWKADVEALSDKDWNTLTPEEREQALRLQYEQMVYQATGKLPPVASPKL